jgi:hypothetical protein
MNLAHSEEFDQTPLFETAAHCAAQALAAKRLSIALDIGGAVPIFGNLFSGTVEGIQALDAAYYGGLAVVNVGNMAMNPSGSGAVSTGTSVGLTVASLALNGSKTIPVAGNVISGLTGLYDSYQAYKATGDEILADIDLAIQASGNIAVADSPADVALLNSDGLPVSHGGLLRCPEFPFQSKTRCPSVAPRVHR